VGILPRRVGLMRGIVDGLSTVEEIVKARAGSASGLPVIQEEPRLVCCNYMLHLQHIYVVIATWRRYERDPGSDLQKESG